MIDPITPSRRTVLTGGLALAGALAAAPFAPAFALPTQSDLCITELKTFVMPDALYIKITTDSGVSGWGETDAGRPALFETFVQDLMARRVVGRDPFDTGPIIDDIFYAEHDFGPGGALANSIAGIDIALWDLKARILEVPVHRLLGGAYRDKVAVYGSYGTRRWSSMTPDQAVAKAVKFADNGFKTVKCRMQIRESHLNPPEDRTVEYIDRIHRALRGRAELFTDINNGYSANRAIQVGRILQEEYGMRYFEEPCSDQNHSETRRVGEELDMAIIAGEKEYTPFQIEELIRYADPDYLNPDVIKGMGITGMAKIGVLSQVNQKPIIMHNTRPVLSTAASLQLAASFPTIGPFMADFGVDDHVEQIAVADTYFDYDAGEVAIPQTPGLGIEINEDRVSARSTSIRSTLADEG